MRVFLGAILLVATMAISANAANLYIAGWRGDVDSNGFCVGNCLTSVDYIFQNGDPTQPWEATCDGCFRDLVANAASFKWVLIKIENPEGYGDLLGQPDIDRLPDFPLDAKMTAMSATTKSQLQGILDKWGIVADCVSSAESYRSCIRCIGQVIEPTWTEQSWGD